MSQTANFLQAAITHVSNSSVGAANVSYTFTMKSVMQLNSGDFILLRPPLGQLDLPSPFSCRSPQQSALLCSITPDNALKLTLSTAVAPTNALVTILSGFVNPSSGQETEAFTIEVYDSEYYAMASTKSSQGLTLQMTVPYMVTAGGSIRTDTDIATSPVVITIQVTLAHDVP